jgi:hypothetical protein
VATKPPLLLMLIFPGGAEPESQIAGGSGATGFPVTPAFIIPSLTNKAEIDEAGHSTKTIRLK